jgi:nicotinate-nucleotide adenylyltransferase
VRRAILGGTFDPPHDGHLSLARAALEELAVDRVWLVPAHLPPHKEGARAGPFHRFAMTALACAGQPSLVPHPVELQRGGRSFTLHTLEELREEGEDGFVLLLGADMLADFPSWHKPREILEMAALGAVPRAGIDMERVLEDLPDWLRERARPAGRGSKVEAGSVVLLSHTPPRISSTQVRGMLARGEGAGSMLPPLVADYIETAGLYREERP